MAEIDIHEQLAHVIAQLNAAITNTSLYSPAHPQVAQYIDHAYAELMTVLQAKPEVTILLIGEDLVADNRPLAAGASASYVTNFARILRRRAVERLTFAAGMPRSELQRLIQELAIPESVSVRAGSGIKLGKVEIRVQQEGAGKGDQAPGVVTGGTDMPEDAVQELLSLSTAELDELKEIYLNIKKHKKINVRSVDEIVHDFVRGFRQEINPLSLLATIKSAHEYTFTHVTNVAILTMSQAESLGFKGEHLHQIGVASLLHDVGKLFVPAEILSKAGMLTQDERRVIETHTVKGARYLMGLEGIPKLAVLAALEHHQKFNGSGYPSIKGGWTPNITSQIITIADVFDAMRSRRSYQEPIPLEKIIEVLVKGSGTSFNPQLVDHFLRLIKR